MFSIIAIGNGACQGSNFCMSLDSHRTSDKIRCNACSQDSREKQNSSSRVVERFVRKLQIEQAEEFVAIPANFFWALAGIKDRVE